MQSFLGQNLGKVIGLLKLDLGMQFSGMFAEVDGAELGQGPYKLGGDLFRGATHGKGSCHRSILGSNALSLPQEGSILLTSVISTPYRVRGIW